MLINNSLPKLMNEFFDDAQDELEKTPDYAENFKDVAAQSNLISVLRMNKAQIVASYCRAVTADLDFTGFKEDAQEGLNDPGSNLSLVEKEVFEDWLNYSTLIRKANAQFKNQLYQLELKLSYVTCFPRYLIKNPIAPERLCECFRKEIASIEDSVVAKRSLYKAFLTTLYDHLPALYKEFENLLAEHGAPQNAAQDIVWKKNFPTNTKPDAFTETFTPGDQLPSFDNDAYHYSDPTYYNDTSTPSIPLGRPVRGGNQRPISQTATKLFNLINQGVSAGQTYLADATQPVSGGLSAQFTGPEYSPDELFVCAD